MNNINIERKKKFICVMTVFIPFWFVSGILFLPGLGEETPDYPQGSAADCLLYNKEYLCFNICICKWNNDTQDCLGRISGDLKIMPKKCNDNIESSRQYKENMSEILKYIFMVCCLILVLSTCIFYIIIPLNDRRNDNTNNINQTTTQQV
jgi:hypothetical protein